MQSSKKDLRIQTINQNKWWQKSLFLTHFRAQTHLPFFRNHSNQTHTLQKITQNIRSSSHFYNKPYKTTPRILSDFTIPGRHHAKRKQYQNRKRIKTGHFSLCTTILSRILSLSLSLPPFFAPLSLWHHIIVNFFDRYAKTPSSPRFSLFLSRQLTKIISTFIRLTISNETW